MIETREALEIEAFVHRLPKAELHLHLEGSLSPATLIALADKHGLHLPQDEVDLYGFADLESFFVAYELCVSVMRDAHDFHRVTYEALQRCASSNGRYVEFFYNPQPHISLGARYTAMTDGIVAGMQDAEKDFGVISRIIPSYDRRLGPGSGDEFVDLLQSDPRDEVIGIGMDYLEFPYRPAEFEALYERARRAGLRVTAHVGFRGPATHVFEAVKVLGCERIDHGYHIVNDPIMMSHCKSLGIGFTCCPTSSVRGGIWGAATSRSHPIRLMIEAGLLVTINTDDPTLMGTNLNNEYLIVAQQIGLDRKQMAEIALNSFRVSWLEDETRNALISQFQREVDTLLNASGPVSL